MNLIEQIQDFRSRVIAADKLRRSGQTEEAEKLMPSREEVITALKAYRQTIGQRASGRATSAKSKSNAAAVAAMDPKSLLD